MTNVIHATGALLKFLDARQRGASDRQLKTLQSAALAEHQNNRRPRAKAVPAEPRGNVVNFDAARALAVKPVFDERIARSWDSVPD